jgi:hypothetical protein
MLNKLNKINMLSESILKKNYSRTFVLLLMLACVSFLFVVGFHWLIYGGDPANVLGYILAMLNTIYVGLTAKETAKNKANLVKMIKYVERSVECTFQTAEVITNSIKEVESL